MAGGKGPNYIDFFQTVWESKRLLRTGWIREGVADPESVAEHSFGVSFLAMVLTESLGPRLDKDKLIKMGLVHDLGELVTGDVVITRGEIIDIEARDRKEHEEREGIRKIFDIIGRGDEYVAIFDEMTGRVTPESKALWQLDKMEMAIQASQYQREQGKDLAEFFVSASLEIKDPLLKRILRSLLRLGKKERKK